MLNKDKKTNKYIELNLSYKEQDTSHFDKY